jgi:hypothetical protein
MIHQYLHMYAGFLRGVIILLAERGILIHNDPFENRQQTQGGVFLSHPHKSSIRVVLSTKKLSNSVY